MARPPDGELQVTRQGGYVIDRGGWSSGMILP
jgi:hypothetical protein